MRESVIGIQPSGGCTPFDAPSQFSQYPCRTLPAGLDFTAQVPPVGEVDGDGEGEGEAEGDGDGDGDGEGEGEGEGEGDGEGDGEGEGEAEGEGDGEGEGEVVPPGPSKLTSSA
ncbi:hypothetical protein [Planotetraspora sp. GP83]|uniref:hypothetical protein n=1 Tax=Planotetraspora sp. GP83 TaxID=3156264 RepID=UPI00387ED856